MEGYGAFARHYDVLTANVDYPRRAAYFDSLVRRFAPRSQGRLLLDLACGTGSLSLELAALGYDVVGADASAEMLSVAAEKASAAGRRVLFLHQSMTELDLYGTVDVTVCALDSLNHLPGGEALARAFERVALFTSPGGLFLFDVNTLHKHRQVLAGNVFVFEPEGLYCVWQNAWNPDDDRVDIALDFFEEQPDGAYLRRREAFSERVFSHQVLQDALERSGFALEACYHEDTTRPPRDDSQRLVYVAKRN